MMKRFLSSLIILILLSSATLQLYGQGSYNVKDFGAKGDSAAFDTEAINKAIDAAVLAGGGTVYFPAGNI